MFRVIIDDDFDFTGLTGDKWWQGGNRYRYNTELSCGALNITFKTCYRNAH